MPSVEDEHARVPGSAAVEVDGFVVAPPLTAGQATVLAREGLLADDVAGLQRVWARLVSEWHGEVDAALAHPGESRLDQRVNGEWSFIETLRHLIFVTDGWIGGGVCGSAERHPLGLPPHFITNGAELGLELDARPDLDAVLAVRKDRQESVAASLVSIGELDAACEGDLAGFTRRGAFQVVVAEERFHLGFARRDLALLRGG